MLPSGCGVLDGFAENKSYFQKQARTTRTHSRPACHAAPGCWQPHPSACINWYSSLSDASWMWTRGVQNHSSHDIISNPFWVLFPGGKRNQSDRKRKIFQTEKQCCTVDKVLQWGSSRQSCPPNAGSQPAGVSVGYAENQWMPCGRLSTLEARKIEREKWVECCDINFQRLLISTQMAQIFLGIGTHTIGKQPGNYQSFSVDNWAWLSSWDNRAQKLM